MGVMQLGPTGSYINLSPEYDFREIKTLQRADIRTKEGSLFTYIYNGRHTEFKIPESWVNSSQRSLVNSWWETATNLEFIRDSDFPSSLENVRIMENKEPYQKFIRPYFKIFYEGRITLETI